MKLNPYLKYKESGVQWIGEIPEEWKFHKLKFMLSSLESGSRENDESAPIDKGAFSIGGEHINWNGTLKLDHERFVSFEYYNSMNRGKIQESDVLLVKDGATIGKTALVIKKPFDKMAVNEHVFILRPNKKTSSKLLYYLIDSDSGFRQIKLTETGSAQGGINTEFANRTLFSITENAKEQEKITDFLDSKTFQLSQTIDADKKLIELLKEKRIALINHVVTKGLNPKAKMKYSGIEWIGEVPEGWEVNKLKQISEINISNVDKKSEQNEPEIFLCNYVDVYKNEFITSKINFMKATASIGQIRKFTIKKGDVIITKDSEEPTDIAIPALVTEELEGIVCGYHLALIRPYSKRIIGSYLFRQFQSKKINDQFVIEANGVTRFGISTYPIINSYMVIPSKIEQIQITEYLDKETSKIGQTIQKIEEKIELLEEYKKSLIHHVVTGKVDVRSVAT